MSQTSALRTFQVDRAVVEVYPSKAEAGKAAALRASAILKAAISKEGRARLILATGNSQEDLVAAWSKSETSIGRALRFFTWMNMSTYRTLTGAA